MKRIAISLLAVAAALLASGQPTMAASCKGNGHEVVLSNGSASPGSSTTSTAIRFSVRYADTAGCAPSRVVVVVQGIGTYPLSGSGSDYISGTTFSRTLSLPAGSHAYSFKATSGKKAAALASVSPMVVVVSAPTPKPKPTPAPPKPTPKAQPAPAPRPPSSPAAASTAQATPSPTAEARTAPPDRSPEVVSSTRTAIDGWWPAMQEPGNAGLLRIGTPREAAAPASVQLAPASDDLIPFGVLASFGLTAVGGLAFVFILLRMRRGNALASMSLMTAPIPSARVDAAASPTRTHAPTTQSGSEASADSVRVSPLPPMRDLIPPIDYDLLRDPDERVGPADGEANVPRWLRPSVRAGRFGEEQVRRRDWGD